MEGGDEEREVAEDGVRVRFQEEESVGEAEGTCSLEGEDGDEETAAIGLNNEGEDILEEEVCEGETGGGTCATGVGGNCAAKEGGVGVG